MFEVRYSYEAEEAIGQYFENYQSFGYRTDMPQRAFHVSRVIACLTHIDAYWEETFVVDGKNYIRIENICTIEFEITNDFTAIVIMNIYFD